MKPHNAHRLRAITRISFASAAALSLGACVVSFDGYELASAGGTSAHTGTAGNTNSAAANGGQSSAGTSSNAQGGSANAGSGGNAQAGVGGVVQGGSAGASQSGSAGDTGSGGAARGGSAGTSSSAGDGGTGGSSGGAQTCPIDKPGPAMIEIPKPSGGIYCIDRTEVTNAHYATFLASNPSTSSQVAACTWNSSFTPDAAGSCNPTPYQPTTKAKHPVSCVDWCDARAYCAWAGKRLCGQISGGSAAPADYGDAAKNQWYRACSHAGDYDFPYGDTYQPDTCVGVDYDAVGAQSTPTPNCQGGYDGLFDMSGNVSEWEDSCQANAGATDKCTHRGGDYLASDNILPTLRCNSAKASSAPSPALNARNTHSPYVGFRCCLDP